ncbi:phage tail assembly chaperone family protein, TAC [Halopseudomonas laoshanensis]|uniref:phage tail assembly chaperone family protein, TAC n=1 Tax=Halopseudomonas laoshanensis TaxID=2268758 RepID=UPI0037352652
MDLSINSLQKMGAFAGPPVKRPITWKVGGEEFNATTYVRRLSYTSAIGGIEANKNGGDRVAARIASSICNEQGEPVFTVGDITGEADPERGPLDESLTMALLTVIGEVNGLGKSKPKSSPRKRKSGVSSSLQVSVGDPSQKPSSG